MLQCHGDADPMVPFVFGTQTAEKMKSLVNPSKITFKTYRGLSHSACPEVSMGWRRVRGESHQCLCHILTVFCLLFLRRKWWISNGSSRSIFRPSEMSEFRGQGSPLGSIRLFLDFQRGCVGCEHPHFYSNNSTLPLEPQGTGMTLAQTDLHGTTLRPDMELSVNVESQ